MRLVGGATFVLGLGFGAGFSVASAVGLSAAATGLLAAFTTGGVVVGAATAGGGGVGGTAGGEASVRRGGLTMGVIASRRAVNRPA